MRAPVARSQCKVESTAVEPSPGPYGGSAECDNHSLEAPHDGVTLQGESTARVRTEADSTLIEDIGTVPFPVIDAGVSTCTPAQ